MTPGKYRAKAIRGTFGESGNKGTPEAVVEFEIADGPFKGESITWHGYFPPSNADMCRRITESLVYCGWDGQDYESCNGITQNEVQIVCEEETDDKGKKRMRVQWVNEVGRIKPMSAGKLEDFKARHRGLVAEVMAQRGAPVAPVRSAPVSNGSNEPEDDSIPF